MAIIRYTLDNKRIPGYISDGGYWGDVDDSTLVGVGSGGGTTMSQADLITRVLNIHGRYPFIEYDSSSPTGRTRTTDEVTTMVNEWCTARGIS